MEDEKQGTQDDTFVRNGPHTNGLEGSSENQIGGAGI